MFRPFRLGRLLGFPIEVNVSFLFLLATVMLFMGGLAGVFMILLAFASVILHELGHALVARHLGVPVAGIELHFFGGMAKMVGQPKRAGDEVAIAAAGPAVSFMLSGLGFLAFQLTGWGIFLLLAWVNVIIGAFNLIPALPMDGGRILRALLSTRMGFVRATEVAVRISRATSVAFALFGVVAGHIQLLLLSVVLWFLASGEARHAQMLRWREEQERMGPSGTAGASPFARIFEQLLRAREEEDDRRRRQEAQRRRQEAQQRQREQARRQEAQRRQREEDRRGAQTHESRRATWGDAHGRRQAPPGYVFQRMGNRWLLVRQD